MRVSSVSVRLWQLQLLKPSDVKAIRENMLHHVFDVRKSVQKVTSRKREEKALRARSVSDKTRP